MRRILGVIMFISGLAGVVLSVVGAFVGWQLVGEMALGLQSNLQLTQESLTTVHETLVLTKELVGQMNEGLLAVEDTAEDVSLAMETVEPLLQQVSVVTAEQVPESLDNFQATLPSLIQIATTIDQALGTLNSLRLLNYDPEVPFGESVAVLGTSLEGVPEDLRALGAYLDASDESLALLSEDMTEIAYVLHEINADTAELEPLIDDYIITVTQLNDSARLAESRLSNQINLIRLVVTGVLLWLGFTQIAPIYLGWSLLTGHRLTDE